MVHLKINNILGLMKYNIVGGKLWQTSPLKRSYSSKREKTPRRSGSLSRQPYEIHYQCAGSDKTTGAMDVKDSLDLSLKDKELSVGIGMT